MQHFQLGFITRNDSGSYAREAPRKRHLLDKILTQCTERKNLMLRTCIKLQACKTIVLLALLKFTKNSSAP
ncbi:IS1 family transposase [Aeromonas dhakensis]